MSTLSERSLCIGEVEIAVSCSSIHVLDELLEPWADYRASGRAPDIELTYTVVAPLRDVPPVTNRYPGFDCVSEDPVRTSYRRRNTRGEIFRPPGRLGPLRARFEGLPHRSSIEGALRLALSAFLVDTGGLLLHAAGVVDRDRALVFPGPSGAGKSTLSRLLGDALPGLRLLGDELVVVRPAAVSGPRAWRAMSTPFGGESPALTSEAGRLAAVYFPEKSGAHRIVPLAAAGSMPRLLACVMAYVRDRAVSARALESVAHLATSVPCCRLELTKDHGFVTLLGLQIPTSSRPLDERPAS